MYKALAQFAEGYMGLPEEDKSLIHEFFKKAKSKGLPFEVAFAMVITNRKELLEIVRNA